MEVWLVWWNLTWDPRDHYPVYSLRMDSELRCHHAISKIRDTVVPKREILGYYNRTTHVCRVVIFR